jgi:hypothetical protein
MPLDVTVVRQPVDWNRAASAALREGVESLEDHLIGLGSDDLDLRIEVRKLPARLASVQADLVLPFETISRHGEEADLPLLLTRVLDGVRDEPTPERLARAGASPREPSPSGTDDPWAGLKTDLDVIAHREVAHAVEFGDIPAGWVEASELADEAIVEAMSQTGGEPPSLRVLAKRVRALLTHRIRTAAQEAGDVFLDEVAPTGDVSEAMVQDDFYDFRIADEAPLRVEDLVGECEPPEDRIAVDEPTESP